MAAWTARLAEGYRRSIYGAMTDGAMTDGAMARTREAYRRSNCLLALTGDTRNTYRFPHPADPGCRVHPTEFAIPGCRTHPMKFVIPGCRTYPTEFIIETGDEE